MINILLKDDLGAHNDVPALWSHKVLHCLSSCLWVGDLAVRAKLSVMRLAVQCTELE
jgi:hypothetical protein